MYHFNDALVMSLKASHNYSQKRPFLGLARAHTYTKTHRMAKMFQKDNKAVRDEFVYYTIFQYTDEIVDY